MANRSSISRRVMATPMVSLLATTSLGDSAAGSESGLVGNRWGRATRDAEAQNKDVAPKHKESVAKADCKTWILIPDSCGSTLSIVLIFHSELF